MDNLINKERLMETLGISDDCVDCQHRLNGLCLWKPNMADVCEIITEMPSAEPGWIPVKTRLMDEEEREYYREYLGWELDDDEAITFYCPMPCDGQEVWVCSKSGNVWQDTCEVDEGIGLEENGDWMDIIAWMPYERPEPWKGEVR